MFNTSTLFNQFAPTSKVWVFTASQPFTAEQEKTVQQVLKPFIDTWAAHGAALEAAFTIANNRFIIVCVNDNAASASGCSIDKLFHAMQEVEQVTGYTILDRSLCAYIDRENNIATLPFEEFKKQIVEGIIGPDVTVFNNSIDNLSSLKTEWQMPLGDSVFKRWMRAVRV